MNAHSPISADELAVFQRLNDDLPHYGARCLRIRPKKEMGYATKTSQGGKGEIVRAINFGSSPFKPNPVDRDGRPEGGYANRRAEMWGKSKEWLQDIAGVDLPDTNSRHTDACAP